jgi:hypothetical protein
MNTRTYSLFVKENGKYTRISPIACSLHSARSLFRGEMLPGTMRGYNMALRIASDDFTNSAKYKADRDRIFLETT